MTTTTGRKMNSITRLLSSCLLTRPTTTLNTFSLTIMLTRKLLFSLCFFYRDEDCIVDVRDAITKDILSYKRFLGRYVIKVEPHRAIMEPDYFIKQIEIAEQNRDEEIERVEAGIEEHDEAVDPNLENEWEKLQKLPNDEYLMKTVLPVLYQGMKIVD